MKVHGPIPHWNNFTVPQLKEIVEHCRALERLGIAQDEEMVVSIERDITLREKNFSLSRYVRFESKPMKQQIPKHLHGKTTKRNQPQDYLLAQNV
jgi:hypothetical protein